jgi:glycosyltransferase involved in cell wall biosynthesis
VSDTQSTAAHLGTTVRVLVLGPLPPPIGGDTRHFKTLVDDLHKSNILSARVIDVSRGLHFRRALSNIATASSALLQLLVALRSVDVVSVHASDRGMVTLGAAVVAICRCVGKPCVIRLFGGSFGDFYANGGRVRRWWMRHLVLKADIVLIQTKRMIRQLEAECGPRAVWFSTYLPADSTPVPTETVGRTCRRFVFLGHLWRSKGVGTILRVARELPTDVTIDLWGPLDEFTEEQICMQGAGRVTYRGVLERSQVLPTLREYDCLLLPTRHPGEGYPGVIVEAFTAGIPVISTKWLAIPEIVDESCGLLIDPDNAGQLSDAIGRLCADSLLWRKLCVGATAQASQFAHSRWAKVFEDTVVQAHLGRRAPPSSSASPGARS